LIQKVQGYEDIKVYVRYGVYLDPKVLKYLRDREIEVGYVSTHGQEAEMFDIDKAVQKGLDPTTIKILKDINENTAKRESCKLHDFNMLKLGKYECKNCGCKEDSVFVAGYKQGLSHGRNNHE
jgi:hypothetical protein